jgi:DNA-binding CsgD family transcriptional regulator
MEIKFDTPTLVYASKMQTILHYLEHHFKINFFCFSRRFFSSPPFSISTNTAWHLRYKEEYEAVDSFMDIKRIQQYQTVYVWGAGGFQCKKEQQLHEERSQSFAIPPGVSLIHKTSDYIDSYSFSSSMIFNDRITTFLNAAKELQRFGLRFSHDISPMIAEFLKKNSYKLPSDKLACIELQQSFDANPQATLLTAKGQFKGMGSPQDIFTHRQLACIYCAAQGLSTEQTGQLLQVSKRTVESILNTCILTIGSANKYQLIYLATKYGLLREDLIAPGLKKKIEFEQLNK